MSVIYKPLGTGDVNYNLHYGLTSEQEMEVIELRTIGKLSIDDIATIMDCTRLTIEKVFSAYGLPNKMDRWPLDELSNLVRSCNNWKEFRVNYSEAYEAARKKGVIAHLKKLTKPTPHGAPKGKRK